MQKFNKAFAPRTAKPGLRRQEGAAWERRKGRERECGGREGGGRPLLALPGPGSPGQELPDFLVGESRPLVNMLQGLI